MGTIMAVGVGVANGNLLITFANELREEGYGPVAAAIEAGRIRLRPIIMTALAMILGMLPMALALGSGAEQNAPLGRAVIGGLIAATLMTLFVVPAIYSIFSRNLITKQQRDHGSPVAGRARGMNRCLISNEDDPKNFTVKEPGGFFFAGWMIAVLVLMVATAGLVLARERWIGRQTSDLAQQAAGRSARAGSAGIAHAGDPHSAACRQPCAASTRPRSTPRCPAI